MNHKVIPQLLPGASPRETVMDVPDCETLNQSPTVSEGPQLVLSYLALHVGPDSIVTVFELAPALWVSPIQAKVHAATHTGYAASAETSSAF